MTKPRFPSMSLMQEPLHGRKVTLRPFQREDITPAYLCWLSDPNVVKYSNQRFHQHTVGTCQQYLATFQGSDNHFLAICDRGTQALAGTLTVYRNTHHGTADIGIMVGNPTIWRKGVGLDAFQTVVDALARSGEIRKITAGTLAVNVGMVRILRKSSFEWEATRNGQELVDGQPVDVVYYAKFCDAWS